MLRKDVVFFIKVSDSNPYAVVDNLRITYPVVINSDNTDMKHIEEWVGL